MLRLTSTAALVVVASQLERFAMLRNIGGSASGCGVTAGAFCDVAVDVSAPVSSMTGVGVGVGGIRRSAALRNG